AAAVQPTPSPCLRAARGRRSSLRSARQHRLETLAHAPHQLVALEAGDRDRGADGHVDRPAVDLPVAPPEDLGTPTDGEGNDRDAGVEGQDEAALLPGQHRAVARAAPAFADDD